jgi:hypothetical protein
MTVARSRLMPLAPIKTKTKNKGARLGTRQIAAAPNDLQSNHMSRKICAKAPTKLLTWPLTSNSAWSANRRPWPPTSTVSPGSGCASTRARICSITRAMP